MGGHSFSCTMPRAGGDLFHENKPSRRPPVGLCRLCLRGNAEHALLSGDVSSEP